jgi:hypothetical protein
MAVGAVFAWIVSAVGSFFKVRTDRWQAEAALHGEKRRSEFELVRNRIEELHEKLEAVSSGYEQHLLGWQAHLNAKKYSETMQLSNPIPPLPEDHYRVGMVVSFYAPELEPSIVGLLDLRAAYIRKLWPLIEGATDLSELQKAYLELHTAVRELQNEAVESYRMRLQEYLEPPDDPNDLQSNWKRVKAFLLTKRKITSAATD